MTRAASSSVTEERGPSAEDGVAPLTKRQTLFWLDGQLYPAVVYHNVALLLELRGPLDVGRLEAAFRRTVAEIDQLRLVIEVDGGEPRQRVRKDLRGTLEHVDLSSRPEAFDAWLAERVVRPFDPSRQLFDAVLVRLAPTRHVFYLCQHHMISDGASCGHIARHLGDLYSGRKPPERPSFLEYVAFEKEYLGSRKAERDARYWAGKLGAGVPPLRFYGRARTDRSPGVARVWCDLGRERTQRLAELAQTEPMLLITDSVSRLVALATLLFAFMYRVTGNRELAIGAPVTNRTARFSDCCGLLMEQTFLCTEIDDDETFSSLAEKVRREIFFSFRHGQHCISDRGLSYVTLNMLLFERPRFDGLDVHLRLSSAPTLSSGGAEGDLRNTFGVQVHDMGGESLALGLDFHEATFDPDSRRLAEGHLLRLFDAMTTQLDIPLDGVDLVTEDERGRLLERARGPTPAGDAADLVQRFRAQAERRAAHVAVISKEGSLTYRDLAAQVSRLSRALRERGVGPGERVGMYLPRGPDELVTMLATLEAGGTYVPLDPTHPAERVRLILEDALPRVLVTHGSVRAGLDVPRGVDLLLLDEEEPRISAGSAAPLGERHDASSIGYVLFTSGSTGRPKGVEVSRGAFANFLRSMEREPGLHESDRLLAVTTTTFDIAGLELMLPLWVGATVQIADRDTVVDPRLLRAVLEQDPVTVMQATPASWRLLVEAGFTGSPLLRALCGGEALSVDLARVLAAGCRELWNLYGPTETTVWSTVKRLEPGFDRITIGRPIDHTTVYVMDPAQHLVPEGVLGEICIGGRGLARGYLGRPDLTAERFVPNPYGPPGDRLYRTGDLGRLLPDGELECAGRVDHQVKIRGFRIELGEVEAALLTVPGVKAAVVVARSDDPKNPRLIAYYTGEEIDRRAFQECVSARLPVYMHPSAYVRLEAFPLNTNGKVDRKALPAPTFEASTAFAARQPRNDAETRMALLFQEVLGGGEVGIDEDFFALGGSSPLVIQLRGLIQRDFGVELPLRVLFETPTVEQVVARLGSKAEETDPIVVRLRQGKPGTAPLFCLLGVHLYQDLAHALPSDRPVYGMHVPIRYVPGVDPHPAVPEVARHYSTLIRAHQPHGPYHLAGLCFGGIVAFEVAAQLAREGEEVRFVALLDASMPSATRVNHVRRARDAIAMLIADPARFMKRLREKHEDLMRRLRTLRQGEEPTPSSSGHGEVELSVLSPGTLAETKRYEDTVRRVPTELVLFRALDRDDPAWQKSTEDFGWRHLGRKFSAYDVPGGHLEILREPNVRHIARVLEKAFA